MKKNITNINVLISDRVIDLALESGDELIKTYSFKSKASLSKEAEHLCVVTMLRWVICENINTNFVVKGVTLKVFEYEYLVQEAKRLIQLYSRTTNDAKFNIPDIKVDINLNHEISQHHIFKDEVVMLGNSSGKDSLCCDLLLKRKKYQLEYIQFDFDDALFIHDFHTSCKISCKQEHEKISTQCFCESLGISYYQEEDMHIIYIAPILVADKLGYYCKMCCGIQWDMLSVSGSSVVLSESIASIDAVIKLARTSGFDNFGIIFPLGGISSFGVYRILAEEIGVHQLDNYNSCWVSDKACGKCLKCKRVQCTKEILQICLNNKTKALLDYVQTIDTPLELLFGSENIANLLKSLTNENIRDITKEIYIRDVVSSFDYGFSRLIKKQYGFQER